MIWAMHAHNRSVKSLYPLTIPRLLWVFARLGRFLSVALQVYTVPFLRSGKPVFNVEYSKDYSVCPTSISLDIDTIFKVGQQT